MTVVSIGGAAGILELMASSAAQNTNTGTGPSARHGLLRESGMSVELLKRGQFTGRVEWIGTASAQREPMQRQETVELIPGGIPGEHHFRKSGRSNRQVTLIQWEHLSVVASLLNRDSVEPAALRRNIAVSGINLASLRNQQFRIGEAVLKGTGDCVPCSRMEETLGEGGYAAMVGHGGITAVVECAGKVGIGAAVRISG